MFSVEKFKAQSQLMLKLQIATVEDSLLIKKYHRIDNYTPSWTCYHRNEIDKLKSIDYPGFCLAC